MNLNEIHVVIKGIIEHEGKFLIIKRYEEDEIAAGTWEFAGGKVEFGEDLNTALHREIREEAGLEVAIERILFASTLTIYPIRQVFFITYLCRSHGSEVALSEEHSEYKWADKDEMKRLLEPGIIHDLEKNHIFSII